MGIFSRRSKHELVHAGVLRGPVGFDELVTVSVGPDGPVALWAGATARTDLEAHSVSPGFASFPESRTSSAPSVALTTYDATSSAPAHVVVVDALPVAHPLVQPLPGGRFLVAGARCAWSPEGAEQNALVIDPDGSIALAGTIGDGIEHLLVDADGDIWAGYFDEGIFGNYGWGGPGPPPLGSSGIVRWSQQLEKRWEYDATDGYWLADCYTLNVGADRVWACPYTDFPVLEIDAGAVTLRPTTDVRGPRGLLVAGDQVALIGGYRTPGSLLLGSLGALDRLERTELTLPRGRALPPGTLVCRDSVAHLFVGSEWFTFDLAATT